MQAVDGWREEEEEERKYVWKKKRPLQFNSIFVYVEQEVQTADVWRMFDRFVPDWFPEPSLDDQHGDIAVTAVKV